MKKRAQWKTKFDCIGDVETVPKVGENVVFMDEETKNQPLSGLFINEGNIFNQDISNITLFMM
jgi:hypothetical protein